MTPSSPLALVTDTNIWIDLEHGGVLALVFDLPYQFLVPDFAIAELSHPSWATLQAHGALAQSLTPDLVQALFRLRANHQALSVTDLAAFLTAQALDAILLTGDRHLAELANQPGSPFMVCSGCWTNYCTGSAWNRCQLCRRCSKSSLEVPGCRCVNAGNVCRHGQREHPL